MNRFDARVSFSDAALADHERLRASWATYLGPIVGPEDAAVLFTICEVVCRATERLHFANRVAFMTSCGVEHRKLTRLFTARALAMCSGILMDEQSAAVLAIVSPSLTEAHLLDVAIKLRDHERADVQRRDATP
jgi:hypothetical protein